MGTLPLFLRLQYVCAPMSIDIIVIPSSPHFSQTALLQQSFPSSSLLPAPYNTSVRYTRHFVGSLDAVRCSIIQYSSFRLYYDPAERRHCFFPSARRQAWFERHGQDNLQR